MLNENDSLKKDRKGVWKRFFKMLYKARLPYLWILLYIALSFGLTNVGVSTTEYTAEMFAGNVSFSGVILPFIIFSTAGLLIGTLNGIAYYICTSLIDRNLRCTVWKKIVRLPMNYYDSNEPSELLSRITTDTSDVSMLIMQVCVSCITSLYSLFVMVKKIVSYDVGLIIALLICVPFVIGIPAVLSKFNFGFSDRVNRRNAELTQEIAEKVNNIETIKSFSKEEKEAERGRIKMKNLYNACIRRSWLSQLTSPMYIITGVIQTLVIVIVGRHYYMSGSIDLTQWIAFFAFSASVCANLTAFSGYWDSFKLTQGSTNRVAHILEDGEEDLHSGADNSDLDGDIRFGQVCFSYDGEIPVLKQVSFTVPAGKMTVIVGPSGSGKSTVIHMLERFYCPDSGQITVGGKDIFAYELAAYRRQFTCITQNSIPVSGTIRDNLLYGIKHEVSDEELMKACKLVDAYDFIFEYENGLDEKVGENGKNLSGGQRQKLAIAKIFLTDTKYIILDEATSAMDVKSTDRFLDALKFGISKTSAYRIRRK